MPPLEWSLLIALAIMWGGSFFFIGVAVQALPPFTIVMLRVGLAAITLNVLLIVTGNRLPFDRDTWRVFLVMGLVNNLIPFALITWGQTHIASGLASILNATTPLFAIVVAHYFTTDEKMTAGRLAGVLIGLVGVVAMVGPAALQGLSSNLAAQLAVIGAAIGYAVSGVYGRRFKHLGISPMVSATGMLTASAIMMVPIVIWRDQPWLLPLPSVPVWGAVFALALVSTVLAYIVYFRLLSTTGATNLLLVTFLVPVSAILLGALILGERLAPIHFFGMALIGLGLAAIDGRPWRFCRQRLWPQIQP
ncbi:MAG: DMT family transporter [Alphaproteobacteria bacterium]